MKELKSKGSSIASIVKSMSIFAGERPVARELGVGCVGSGPTLDEAENADEELVANKSC